MYIGFNVLNAGNVITQIGDAFKKADSSMHHEFHDFIWSFRLQWVGPDEKNFELELCDYLTKLMSQAAQVASTARSVIYNLVMAWLEFQSSNNSSGSSREGWTNYHLIKEIEKPEPLTSYKFYEPEWDGWKAKDNLGLVDSNSANIMRASLEKYVNYVKATFKELFATIENNNAFFGEHSVAVKQLIDELAVVLGEIGSAINSFEEKMFKLTGNYTGIDNAFVSTMNTHRQNIASSVEDLGSNRWDA